MKRTAFCIALLFLLAGQAITSSAAEAYKIPEDLTAKVPMDERKALQLLIHINWVASRIHRSQTVLEDEYNQINVANLDLSYLKDEEAVESLKALSTAITNARKKRGDEKMAEHVRDTQLKNSFFSSAPNPVAIISKDWRAMAFVAAQAGFSWFMNYRAIRAEVKLQYDQEMWRIEKDDMENVNTFYNEMLDHQSRIVNRYSINDMFRVTDQDFARLLKYLEESDDKSAFDFLCQNQSTYLLSAFYWYHRGVLARKLKKSDEAMRCFRTFQSIHVPFIRRDKMAALVAQGIIELLSKEQNPDKKEIQRQLAIIEKNAQPEDWELHYFMAGVRFDLLKDYTAAEASIRKAITHLNMTFNQELKEYLTRLADKDILRFGRKSDDRKNVPPSSENLAQCRAFLFQILSASDPSKIKGDIDYYWGQYSASDLERLWMASFLDDKKFVEQLCRKGFKGGANIVSSKEMEKENGRTIVDDSLAVFVDYDYDDTFWVDIPLRWVYFMPTTISFSIYGENGKEVYRGNEVQRYRRTIVRYHKPFFQFLMNTDGAKRAKVDPQKISGYSLNFDHPNFRAKLYVKNFGTDKPIVLNEGKIVVHHVEKEKTKTETALDRGHRSIFTPIKNPQNANLNWADFYGFLLSFESALDGSCTMIDLSEALSTPLQETIRAMTKIAAEVQPEAVSK